MWQVDAPPASHPEVISVAAIDENKDVASFSTRNKYVELTAPGVATLKWRALGDEVTMTDVPVRTVRYESWSGTSMAAPHVTAAAALLWSARPDATREELRTALQLSAEDLGVPGRDHETGFGLVRPTAAIYHLPEAWVCQITERLETSCSDGIDNDCNGDIDDADANCP